MIKRKSPIKRSPVKRSGKPIKRRNPARKRREFARAYGSKERVAFIRGLACAACGVVGYSENAHVPPKGEAGTGHKADYRFIAPLCGKRTVIESVGLGAWDAFEYIGCHKLFDEYRWEFDESAPDFDPVRAVADCERMWLEHSNAV